MVDERSAERVQALYQEILRRRAERLGVPLEEAASIPNDRPLFLLAAEEIGRLTDRTAEQVLADYDQRLREASWPTPECPAADVLVEYAREGGAPCEMRVHLNSCVPCRALFEVSQRSSGVGEEGGAR